MRAPVAVVVGADVVAVSDPPVPAGELMRRLVVLAPRMTLSRLPSMLDTYCRARLVPQWAKAGWRRMRNAEPRPPYHEMAW